MLLRGALFASRTILREICSFFAFAGAPPFRVLCEGWVRLLCAPGHPPPSRGPGIYMELVFVVIPRESAHWSTTPVAGVARQKGADDRGALFASRMLLREICFSIMFFILF